MPKCGLSTVVSLMDADWSLLCYVLCLVNHLGINYIKNVLHLSPDSSPTESPVYGQKGASVHLTVEGLQRLQIIRITWKYNNTDIVEHTLDSSPSYYNKNYTEKIQFDSSDFSLLIKKLDETNRGIYTATIKDKDRKDFVKAKYHLHVLAVAKPIIQMNNLTLDSAEGFCTVSVNCSVRDSWVYYTCNQTQCSQTEPQSWPDVNITVTVDNGNIICTGSNRVSMNTDGTSESPSSWYIVLILGILCLCLCIGLIYFVRRRNRHTRNSEVT
uniref:Immunoglobulin V-set domain-containing protein n=1 Tax=Paramormyrops kingsleyae TaxID=1676925 RepID=A0A3B3S1J8_9TELE